MDSDLWQLIQHNTCQKTVDGNGQKLEKRQKPNFPQNQLFVNQTHLIPENLKII